MNLSPNLRFKRQSLERIGERTCRMFLLLLLQRALEQLQQKLTEEQQSHTTTKENLKSVAAVAEATAAEQQLQLQQHKQQIEEQEQQLKSAQAEALKNEANIRALKEVQEQLKDELRVLTSTLKT